MEQIVCKREAVSAPVSIAPAVACAEKKKPSVKGKSANAGTKAKKTASKVAKELGKRGEEAAARFLAHRGYEILERNWTCFAGEADIIAKDGDTIVFVEVKTRSGSEKGFPSEAVTPAKRARYEKIALAYLAERDFGEMRVRFDCLALVVLGKRAVVRHHVNAFSCP